MTLILGRFFSGVVTPSGILRTHAPVDAQSKSKQMQQRLRRATGHAESV